LQVSPRELVPGAGTLDDFLRSHKAVLGKTRSGKSKLLEYWFYRTRLRALYVNPHRVPLRAKLAASPEDVIVLLAKGHSRIQWQPPREHEVRGGKKEILRQFGRLVALLFDLGRKLMGQKDKAEPWLLLLVDECQLFASKTGSIGPLEMVVTEGAKFGIVGVNATQRPARASLEVMGQAGQVVVFRLNPEDVEYLRKRNYPVDEFLPWIQGIYQFVLMDAERWVPYEKLNLDAGP
jgi:hypothetical protein